MLRDGPLRLHHPYIKRFPDAVAGLAALALGRAVPLGATQLYLTSIAGLVGLWPLAWVIACAAHGAMRAQRRR